MVIVNDKTIIRIGAMADASAIAEVHALSKRAAYRGLVPELVLASISADERLPMWQNVLANETLETLVAHMSGELVGFVLLGPTNDSDCSPVATMEVHALYVAPGRWRRGIGRALMTEAAGRGVLLCYSDVIVWTALPDARQFYESFGFIHDGSQRVSPLVKGSDIEVTDVRYRKCLLT